MQRSDIGMNDRVKPLLVSAMELPRKPQRLLMVEAGCVGEHVLPEGLVDITQMADPNEGCFYHIFSLVLE